VARESIDLPCAQALALRHNSAARGVFLDRQTQALALEVGEGDLQPKFNLSGQVGRALVAGVAASPQNVATATAGAALKLPVSTQVSVSLSRSNGSSTRLLQVIQPLLKNAGDEQGTLSRNMARLRYEQAGLQGEQTLEDLYVSVALAYYQALQARMQLAAAERSVRSLSLSLASNQALLEAGRISRLDLLQVQADLAQARLAASRMRNVVSGAMSSLMKWWGAEFWTQEPSSVELVDLDQEPDDLRALPADEQALLAKAFQLRRDWKLARSVVDLAHLDWLRARNDMLPELNVSASVQSVRAAGAGPSSALGVTFSLPLDRAPLRLQENAAAVVHRKAELALEDLRSQIIDDVRTAVREEAFSVHQLALAERNESLNRQKLEAENDKFLAGRSSAFQLSAAQSALNDAEAGRIQAVFAVRVSRLQKLRVTGGLPVHLQ